MTYALDFGDGTSLPAQATATATHTYTTAGTHTVTVTVRNVFGLSNTAQQSVTAAPAPGYVATLGTTAATTTKTSGVVTVGPAAGVRQGDLVVVTLQILAKSANGAVAVTDTAGNTYTVARDVATTSGRLVVLTGLAAKPLPAGAKITATFPGSTTYQLVADELTGVTRVDRATSATGTTAAYSSGETLTTTSAREVVFGAVASFTATTNPTWSSSWTKLMPQAAANTDLGRAYQLPTSTGTFKADGTTSGTWAALVLTFQP